MPTPLTGIPSRPPAVGPALGLLFMAALALLSIGIWEPTGVTGKDEYYLGLRTPMCMLELDRWLVPCLDGEPRLKKPPMMYWLTGVSYSLFGVSLTSARSVASILGALWVVGVALVALELDGRLARALRAGLIMLSFLSLHIVGRMLELDLPVAAFSTLAFYCLLRWYRRGTVPPLIAAAVLLASGFLTKGPVVLVVCGAGALALLAFDPAARAHLARHRVAALGAAALFIALVLPWFVYVHRLYPQISGQELAAELGARRFPNLSVVPLYGFLMLALPWSFAGLTRLRFPAGADTAGRDRTRSLLLWLALTLLPFFFIKTFERYLYGSLVPFALLLALGDQVPGTVFRWAARGGLVLTLVPALALIGVVLWLAGPHLVLLLAFALLVWYLHQWWRADNLTLMALSAALLWACILGLVYPRVGINGIPPALLEQVRDGPIVLYDGPQPALLPAVLGRSLVHLGPHKRLPAELTQPCARFLVLTPAERSEGARHDLQGRGLTVRDRSRFGILSSRVKWQNMARRGLTREQLWDAIVRRDLEAIKPQVVVLEVEQPQCPSP